uniref:Uncharacterized protein n=1 Tax=Arundo donax TaxID=35708 RepID=A0A0A9ALT9_ARUDO
MAEFSTMAMDFHQRLRMKDCINWTHSNLIRSTS